MLSLVGIVAILALSVAAVFYFFSSGDAKAVQVAKKYTWATVLGLLVAFSALIVIRQLSKLLL